MKINLNQILKITFLIVVVLGLVNLVSTNILATSGHELDQIQQQALQLEKDNYHLKNQIAKVSSLAYLEHQAQNLGYIQISQAHILTTPAPVAYVAQ